MSDHTLAHPHAPPAHEPRCTRCDYSLAGLPPEAPCPECNLPRPALADFLLCPHCGYHLRGLRPEAACPECGRPASDAVVEYPLFRAGLDYVSRLASGAGLVLTSAYMIALGFLLVFTSGLLLPALASATGGVAAGTGGMLLISGLFLVLIFGASIVWLVGWLRATTPDPVYGRHAPGDSHRATTRGLAIACFSMQFGSIIPLLGILVFVATIVCAVVMFFSAAAYIRALAGRIPHAKLEKSATTVRAVGGVTLLIFGSVVGFTILDATTGSGNFIPFGVLISFVLYLLLMLVYIRLVGTFAKAMKKTRRRALEAKLPGKIE